MTNFLSFSTHLGLLQDAAVHQHSNCICASFLHVPFLHQVSPESHCCLCPLPSCQSGRTTKKVGACHQGGPHDSLPQSKAPWRQFRGSWHWLCPSLFTTLSEWKNLNPCCWKLFLQQYHEQAQELINNENILLQTLGFDVAIDHPHTQVLKCCQHLFRGKHFQFYTSIIMLVNIMLCYSFNQGYGADIILHGHQ